MKGQRISNKIVIFLLLMCVGLTPLIGKEDHRVEYQPVAIEQTVGLNCQGVLRQKENGFIYLDVSNEWIDAAVPHLEIPGELRARPTAAKSVGAHISVFDEREGVTPNELGSSFQFIMKDIRSFTMHTRDGLKKLWVIAVDAPELEMLREQYGCSSKMKGRDFHITLGKQMPKAPEGWEKIDTISQHCFANFNPVGLEEHGDFTTVQDAQLLSTVQKVNAVGQLVLKGNGFVYVNVDNQFIEKIADQLPIEGDFKPLTTTGKVMGAHISVFYEDEMIGNEIWELKEAGEWFDFEVKQVRHISRKTPNGENKLWLIAVESPSLEHLRTSYGLKPKLKGYDFHITLGNESIKNDQAMAAKAA